MNLPNLPEISLGGVFAKVDFGRWQTIVAPFAAIVVSLAIFILVIWPKFTEAFRIKAKNVELEARVSGLGEKAQFLQSLDKFLLDQQLAVAEAMLPSDEALFSFVRQVESAAATSGVTLNKIDVGPSPTTTSGAKSEAESGPKIQVKVSLTSDYRALVAFLERIISLPRANGIFELTISSSAIGGQSGTLRTFALINAFWRPLPGDLGLIETPVSGLTEKELELLDKAQVVAVSTPSFGAVVPLVPTGKSDLFAPF